VVVGITVLLLVRLALMDKVLLVEITLRHLALMVAVAVVAQEQ
jgi:hypothetical protein